MDWFLYDNGLRHESVNENFNILRPFYFYSIQLSRRKNKFLKNIFDFK